jgi:Tir chaperone protein (CesT) family
MMATRDTIEHYLIQTGHPFETIDNNTWVVRDAANIVISYASPLVIFRVKLMDLPQRRREAFFRLLLELNASEMVHGAYGLENNSIVLIDTLQSEHLDLNELQATLDALLLAIAQDYQKLNAFRG